MISTIAAERLGSSRKKAAPRILSAVLWRLRRRTPGPLPGLLSGSARWRADDGRCAGMISFDGQIVTFRVSRWTFSNAHRDLHRSRRCSFASGQERKAVAANRPLHLL